MRYAVEYKNIIFLIYDITVLLLFKYSEYYYSVFNWKNGISGLCLDPQCRKGTLEVSVNFTILYDS